MGYGVGVWGAGDGCRSSRTGEADLRQSSGRAACLIVAQEENRNRCLRSHGHCVRAFVLCCLERHCVEVPVEGGRLAESFGVCPVSGRPGAQYCIWEAA